MLRSRLLQSVVVLGVLLFVGTACGSQSSGKSSFELGAKSAPPERSTAYTIASQERADEGGRARLKVKLVLAKDLDTDRAIEAIRGAMQELLPADGEVQAVDILVYNDESEISGDFTFGHALAAKDGKGWDGTGWFTMADSKVSDRSNLELDYYKKPGELEHVNLAR